MRKKCPYSELYCIFLRIQFKCGQMGTRITPNTDTFYVIGYLQKFFINVKCYIKLLSASITLIFAQQINGLVSIRERHWHLMG